MSLPRCSPPLLAHPPGKHCAWAVLTQLRSPAPGSALLTFSSVQSRANGVTMCPQGTGTRASRRPGAMDDAHGSVPLTRGRRGEGLGAWGRILPTRLRAAAPRLGCSGGAGRGVLTCPAEVRLLGIAFAFASVLKNNPLACQGYKQRTNCFRS